jgi:hypothetical protein
MLSVRGRKCRGGGCRSRAAAEDPKFISHLILPFALDIITAKRLAQRSSLDLGNGSDNVQGSELQDGESRDTNGRIPHGVVDPAL